MASKGYAGRAQLAAGIVAAAFVLTAIPAAAESIEFSCQRLFISNPGTLFYQVDLAASTGSLVSGDVQFRETCPATITSIAIDWMRGSGVSAQKHHIDRLSGHETLLVWDGNGSLTVEFDCKKTSGF